MEEGIVKQVATASKTKKLKYEDLPLNATIIYEITINETIFEDGAVEIAPKKVEKSGSKAFWDGLEEWPKGSKAGQKKDITDGLRTPKLIGYYDGKDIVKF